jgi:hypothetical protein
LTFNGVHFLDQFTKHHLWKYSEKKQGELSPVGLGQISVVPLVSMVMKFRRFDLPGSCPKIKLTNLQFYVKFCMAVKLGFHPKCGRQIEGD